MAARRDVTVFALPAFARAYPNDEACIAYLYGRRYPSGWRCPSCGDTREPYRFVNRLQTLRRRANQRHEVSLTAGTIMDRTKMPISTWFWAAYLVTHGPPGMSALQLQKGIGIKRYETAFTMLHKLRAGMVRPHRDLIGLPYGISRKRNAQNLPPIWA